MGSPEAHTDFSAFSNSNVPQLRPFPWANYTLGTGSNYPGLSICLCQEK